MSSVQPSVESQWKPYREYKDSGIEWLGEIPKHWKSASIRWLSQRFAGGTPDRANLDYWDNGTIPWINSGAVNQSLIVKPSTYITEEGYRGSSAKWVPKGALVMALAGQGKTKGMVAQLGISTTCNQSMAAIIPKENTNARFLFWWLTTNYDKIRNLAGGELRDGLNLEILGSIQCPLLPQAEQHAIAAFLDTHTARIDTLIAKKERQIALLKEKRAALISHAVTKGLDPDTEMKDSGVEWLGEVPVGWDVKQFKRVAFYQEGPGLRNWQFTDEGVKVICVTNITEKGIDFSSYAKYISQDEYQKSYKHFTVNKGDLLLSSSGNSWGKISEYITDEITILNTSTIRINSNCDVILIKGYIKWKLQSESSREQLGLMMTGSCQPNFGPSHLAKLMVCVPPITEQHSIAAYLDHETARIDVLVEKVETSIVILREYRTALISAAVTGKIDVRDQQG